MDTKIIDRTVRTQGLKSRSISKCCFIIQLGLRDFTRSLVRKNYQLHEYNYTLVYSMIIYLCKTFYFYYYGFLVRLCVFCFLFFCPYLWAFPDQKSNLSHSSNPSQCPVSPESLTHQATRNPQEYLKYHL